MIRRSLALLREIVLGSHTKVDLNSCISKLFDVISSVDFKEFEGGIYSSFSDDAKPNDDFSLVLDLALAFRDRIYRLVLQKSDIVDREYVVLFKIFGIVEVVSEKFGLELETSCEGMELLEVFEHLSVNNFLKFDGNERVITLELGVIAKILQFKASDAIRFYMFGVLHLQSNFELSDHVARLFLNVFDALEVDFSLVESVVAEVMDPDYFFGLSDVVQRSVFNWQLHVFWNIKSFFNNKRWNSMYGIWKNVLYRYIDDGNVDKVLYTQFFIYHICGNGYESQDDWAMFNREVSERTVALYRRYHAQHLQKRDSGSHTCINIGILKDRLVMNSPYKVEYSLLRNYLESGGRHKVNFTIYLMSIIEKSPNDPELFRSLESIGVRVVDVVSSVNRNGLYNSHLEKAISIYQAIVSDGIDMLVSPNNGYGISDFLMSSDCAKHRVFYSHGNFVYDIPGITARLTHICANKDIITHCGFRFYGVSVKMYDVFYNPPVDPVLVSGIKGKYKGNDTLIFGTIGRLVKMDSDDYLRTVIDIMRRTNSVYLCCGIGNVSSIQERIVRLAGKDMLSRFKFVGYVDSAVYGHVIEFWPDTFPMQHGESRMEFSSKGGLNLTLSSETRSQRIVRIKDLVDSNCHVFPSLSKGEVLETLLDDSFVAFDLDEYVRKFLLLIQNRRDATRLLLRQNALIERIREHRSKEMFDLFLDAVL